MDAVSLAIAAVPLAPYLFVLGAINLRRRPTVMSGAVDSALLALGVSGLVFIGPMNLFLPDSAAARLGWVAWALLMVFYGLCVAMYVLLARPRLVVFNISSKQLRSVLGEMASSVGSTPHITGESVRLPQFDVQFQMETGPAMRNVALVGRSAEQSHSGWRRLQRELASAMRGVEVSPNPRGFTMLAIGLVLAGWPVAQLLQMPGKAVAQRLMDMLRM